jgi:hypothetical protein
VETGRQGTDERLPIDVRDRQDPRGIRR